MFLFSKLRNENKKKSLSPLSLLTQQNVPRLLNFIIFFTYIQYIKTLTKKIVFDKIKLYLMIKICFINLYLGRGAEI